MPGPIVQAIDEHAWEAAEVAPIGVELPATAWPRRRRARGMRLGEVPASRITGGPHDGGWVVSADNAAGRVSFAVPAAALTLLWDDLPPGEYARLPRAAAR